MKGTVRWVEHDGRRVWCGLVGEDQGRPPLLCIPGGPGAPHDYFEPLSPLAGKGRQVIFYDAMGSGRSERPAGLAWTHELYVSELAAVVRGLGLARDHLFAHSASTEERTQRTMAIRTGQWVASPA